MTARTIWYFDFISPFAYLQLPRIRELAKAHPITPCPIVLGAVLHHHGQLGPAEIPQKRQFTYRMVQWLAESSGIELCFPPSHPFKSLAALRLAIACGSSWDAITAIHEHVWRHGLAADTAKSLADIALKFDISDVESAIAAPEVKQQLRANTDEAISAGVFGVPTIRFGKHLIWGNDATPMFESMLADPDCFNRGEYLRLAKLPGSVERAR